MSVDSIIDHAQFVQEVQIGGDIDAAFRDQASLYAYYAERHQIALRQAAAKDIMLKVQEAKIGKELRDAAALAGEKITEKHIEQSTILDRRYVVAKLELNDAQGIAELTKGCLESLKQRRDMLIQIGASDREDRKGDLAMRTSAIGVWNAKIAASAAS